MIANEKIAISGMSLSDLKDAISPLPRFRADQIYSWILKGAKDFSEMSNIPVNLQNELKEKFIVFSTNISSVHDDTDTKKIVLSLKDDLKVEAVLLNDGKERYTSCLSTQAGCPASCVFCKTGSLGFKRNLDSAEIAEQFLHLRTVNNFKIDNIVIMGMGEPFLNCENLRKAIAVFTDPKGLNISRRRITVSTCGIVKGILDFADNGPYIRLALSLTTADEALREKLMPVTKSNPLDKVKNALVSFQQKSKERITLEIPLFGGINTSDKDALSILKFIKGMDAIVNLIPWNPVKGLMFEGRPIEEPLPQEVMRFKKSLENLKIKVTMRLHKGKRINGACGQLGSLL